MRISAVVLPAALLATLLAFGCLQIVGFTEVPVLADGGGSDGPTDARGDAAADASADAGCGPLTCAGGCCSANKCVQLAGSPSACGTGGVQCVDCGGKNGSACVNNTCGCNSEKDCSQGNACTGNRCGTACGPPSAPCNGGCCDDGTCNSGKSTNACGSTGGACAHCGTCSLGPICIAREGMWRCGCNSEESPSCTSVCGASASCDNTTAMCVTK
jgi:hypothetical protein